MIGSSLSSSGDRARLISAQFSALVADAVLDGKASLPEVALGEDEFVELDEEGNVKKSTGRKKKAAKKTAKKATVKKKGSNRIQSGTTVVRT